MSVPSPTGKMASCSEETVSDPSGWGRGRGEQACAEEGVGRAGRACVRACVCACVPAEGAREKGLREAGVSAGPGHPLPQPCMSLGKPEVWGPTPGVLSICQG